jgi:hypothetical protein
MSENHYVGDFLLDKRSSEACHVRNAFSHTF